MIGTLVVSYFLINFIGAVWAIFYSFTRKARKDSSETLVEQYDALSSGVRVTMWVFTFMINILFFLPFRIVKPLLKKVR